MKNIAFLVFYAAMAAISCNDNPPPTGNEIPPSPPAIPYTVINSYPHDTAFFTEGLEIHDGQLFESSGSGAASEDDPGYYPSAFGITDLKTGKVTIKGTLDKAKYFGEGITFFKGKMYQLTWKNGVGFVYDATSYKKIREFKIPAKEGWSLTHDSTHLIMSDGTSNLYFLDPDSLGVVKNLPVSDNNGPVPNINELEYVNGFIYANQWLTPYILKIDANSGKVVGRLDLSNLEKDVKAKDPDVHEMNGVAWNSTTNTLYITGKLWPSIFELRLQ